MSDSKSIPIYKTGDFLSFGPLEGQRPAAVIESARPYRLFAERNELELDGPMSGPLKAQGAYTAARSTMFGLSISKPLKRGGAA